MAESFCHERDICDIKIMIHHRTIKIGKKLAEALLLRLASKNLIVIRGGRGYIMCGYLNMRAAERFKDVAVKVTGVSSIADVLKTNVHQCTSAARHLGIRKGQSIKKVLEIIA